MPRPTPSKEKRAVPYHPTAQRPRRLGRSEGCEVQLRLLERSGKLKEVADGTATFPRKVVKHRRKGAAQAAKRPPARLSASAVEAFAAIGHPQRARMLLTLLTGPATYRAIQKATRLKAGPLYHHVNQLRLAGLITPRQRNLYELTRGGRNLVLLAIAADPLVNDTRRRPLG